MTNPSGTQSWPERLWRNNNIADIARGLVPHSKPFAMYGERQTLGAVENVILWETGMPQTLTVPQSIQLSFVSSGPDTRRFKMVYLDGDLNERIEIVTLNGTTPVLTAATDIRFVNIAYMLDGPLAVTVTGTQGGITYVLLSTGQVQFNGALYRVPAGRRLILTDAYAGATSATADARTVVKIETSFFNGDRFADEGILNPLAGFGLQDVTATMVLGAYAVPAGEIIALVFKTDKAAEVVGGFFGWTEKE